MEPPAQSRGKRKRDSGATSSHVCIVHVKGLKYGELHLLSGMKDAEKKLAKLHDVKKKRLAQPPESPHRMSDTCELIPDVLAQQHGFHWECYKRFTMNLDRLKPIASTSQESSSMSQRLSCRSKSGDKILFTPDCIFCGSEGRKKVRVQGAWTTQGMSHFEYDGWKAVLEMAEMKQDEKLLTRIRGHDLFACEANFHKACRVKYMQKPEKWRSTDDEAKQDQCGLEEAHRKAFDIVCDAIQRDVLTAKKVVKLSDLRQMYVANLQTSKYPNPDYRSNKLKLKLENHEPFIGRLSFCELGMGKSYIIYSTAIDVHTAVKQAFLLGSRDVIESTGNHLRESILDGFSNASELKWPPSPSDLPQPEEVIPDAVKKLLCYIVIGTASPGSERSHRIIQSIGQDICRATTKGSWKLPKHIIMCMSLRHLYRSEKLITLLNRMGHCESYSFALELETALAVAVMKSSSQLSNKIIRQPTGLSVFHSEFDNFDLLVNDLTGKSSVHTAHGIMMQEVENDAGGYCPARPFEVKSKERSLHLTESAILPDCYVSKRKSPVPKVKQLQYPGYVEASETSAKFQTTWLMIRFSPQIPEQQVPGWNGFVSETGETPTSLTKIDYYPVINEPITEYKTVQECLRAAEEATKEVGQDYVITTFDLGVCMKAYPLVWNSPDKYKKHIVLIGPFHLVCAYMKMLGKKMAGSGLAEVLLEAGLIGSGSLSGVMSGKHYDRALHCHKIMLECLERLLLEEYLKEKNADDLFSALPDNSTERLRNLQQCPSAISLEDVLSDEVINKLVEDYHEFRQNVATGHLGKTAQFWLSYMDHVRLVLSLLEAVKTNNFDLYAACISRMTPIFFSFGGQNYARYMAYFSIFLANIDSTHPGALPLIRRGAISVARSFIPGNRCAVDKTMEETFMKHAKSSSGAGSSAAGISGLPTNYPAYQRWIRTTHERSLYVDTALGMAHMTHGGQEANHRDVRPTEIKKGEKLVKKAQNALCSFLNPFEVETKDQLLVVSSGGAASDDVAADVLKAETMGQQARDNFIDKRLRTGQDFFEPVKRLNLKTLNDMNKGSKIKMAKNKVTQFKQQANVAFQLFITSQKKGLQLDLRELMTFPLTPVPYSLATADGYLAKTDKAKALQHLTKDYMDASIPQTRQMLTVYDGNATFYYLKDIPDNFIQICSKIFDIIGKAGDVVFSTDQYLPGSVKSMERRRRGCGNKLILKGEATKKPPDWKLFLSNDENKIQFIKLLLKVWKSDQYASRLHGRTVILICEGKAYKLTSTNGQTTESHELPMLESSQEETDSRVILYINYARSKGYEFVRVKSPDSDVFFVLLHYAASMDDIQILFDTGAGNKQRLINVSKIAKDFGQEKCTALMALHAYTGCDSTSAFRGIGKIKPVKTVMRLPKYIPVLKKLGDMWEVPDELIDELDSFTCAMYGKASKVSKVNDVRHLCINEICAKENRLLPSGNIDMGTLPPCNKSLTQHIRRVNYQVGIWKRAHIPQPIIPKASESHGWEEENGTMDPLWYEGDLLPRELADIAQVQPDNVDSDDDSVSITCGDMEASWESDNESSDDDD